MENILTDIQNNILTITINRPEKLNALNTVVIKELHDALSAASSNEEVKAIILTGAGEKAFVAGADIAEFANYTAAEGEELSRNGQHILFDYIENLNKPVIAAINGFALGGGLELALCCHIRLASDNAKMGLPELNLGVIPGYGGTQRLPQLIGKGKAMELILTSDMMLAQDALRFNLVNYVTTREELMSKAIEIATKICSKSPMAVATAIRAVNANFKDGVNGFDTEIKEFGQCFGTYDFKEGVTAFLEKRKAAFIGK
jgi:enoyl-CoA hydratase